VVERDLTEEKPMQSEVSDVALSCGVRTWREIDRDLRVIAKRRGALDADESRLLCDVVRSEVWRELGRASLHEYLEEVLGYSPRQASERVRVALALDDLPELFDALATGELSFSAVRELTRIATPMTQREWRDEARGKNLRQIEHAVRGRQRGDLPSDPPDPDLIARPLHFDVRPATYALLRQTQQALELERGERLDDDGLITALCTAALAGSRDDDSSRAKFQILTVRCEACGQAWQEGGGQRLAMDAADTARAECDAQRIGSEHEPGRATQDVAPRVHRHVRRRDAGKCCVPGCRAARFVEIHHIVARTDGGDHTAKNLTLLCDGHHRALHDGKLTITGEAPNVVVTRLEPATHVGHAEVNKLALATLQVDAKQALVHLGFKATEARAAIDRAGPRDSLEALVREALRQLR
jgi:hypothetical protein